MGLDGTGLDGVRRRPDWFDGLDLGLGLGLDLGLDGN